MKIKLDNIYLVMSNRFGVMGQSIVSELMNLRPNPTPKACYWFGKMARLFSEEVKHVEEMRTMLIEELGIENEETGTKYIPREEEEIMADFLNKFGDVLAEEIDLPLRKIKVSEFGECPVTIGIMSAMDFMIEDDEEPELEAESCAEPE